jgi:spore germination protein YaaH
MIHRHGLPPSHPPGSRGLPRRGARTLVATVVSVWSLAVLPAFAVAVPPRPSDTVRPIAAGTNDTTGTQPSIQYEEAMAHASDRIEFAPGARVAFPFRPRASDDWAVDGAAPVELPAGRVDGAALRREATGDVGGSRIGVPAPSVDQATTAAAPIAATSSSWSAPGPEADTMADAAIGTTLSREVFGFLPYWELGSSSLRIDYTKVSTIAYFGVGADATGNLQKTNTDGTTTVGWSGWTSANLTNVINAAHQNHTRVVLTIQSFGWSSTGLTRQKTLLGSSTARANLARQIAAAVAARGADGVNLDFEPLASGYESAFVALVRAIRTELSRVHSGYQLTFDTLGMIGNYPIEDATSSGAADAIFVMGYDYRSASSSPVGSIAPLSRNGYDITDTVAAYTARVPAAKVILGVPYYGRAWSTATNTLNASNISGTRYGASVTVIYDTAADFLAQYGRRWDPVERVAWTTYQRQTCTSTYGCQTAWRELYIDDAAALGLKYDLVNRYGLRGAGIWALGYDGTRGELWNMLGLKLGSHTVRYAGADRYATAAMVSARTFAAGVPVAYIANGGAFADALAAAAAAGTLRGPVLLVKGSGIPAATATELKRLRPARIVVLGGAGVVSSGVQTALNAYATG